MVKVSVLAPKPMGGLQVQTVFNGPFGGAC